MAVYKQKGSKNWWYKFVWNGETIRESTKQTNRRIAEQMEAARRTALAKGEVGIVAKKLAPTLREFAPRFHDAIATTCAEKPRTVAFYAAKLEHVMKDSSIADLRLSAITEETIETYKQRRTKVQSRRGKPLSPATVNRELATLRRLLRMAHEWKVIDRVPRIRLLRGEQNREFILSHAQEPVYLTALPEELCGIAILLLDTGLRGGEALSLDWRQVRFDPARGARYGYVTVLSGNAKNGKSRNVPLTVRAAEVLRRCEPSESGLVFHRADGSPLSHTWLDQQHAAVRKILKLPADFVLHSLRHTFGTRLGEAGADAFTIMKAMGHSSVTVSQRYVHPSPEAMETAFERLERLNDTRRLGVGIESGIVHAGLSAVPS